MKGTTIIFGLLLAVLWGLFSAVIGNTLLQPILGTVIGMFIQFLMAFVGGCYAPGLARRLLSDNA